MHKVRPLYHSGQALVQFSEWPLQIPDFLSKHVFRNNLINIAIVGEEDGMCVPYEIYDYCNEVLYACNYDHYFESQI